MTKANLGLLTQRIHSYFSPFKTLIGEPKYTLNRSKVIVHIPYFQPKQEMTVSDPKIRNNQ